MAGGMPVTRPARSRVQQTPKADAQNGQAIIVVIKKINKQVRIM